ncbi:MarR family transcriptional regulator (plasmid) [Cedecea neteri]|jgi:DNA-binding IscR family transcriptional regulator|uniref:MarR family transcriptional regulator n=1 Tax=Cedecea neteri TaxID=158822 RepID=A0A291E628_9ENTR|nr:MarR family transcriptional regulator [Cedecea neteri]
MITNTEFNILKVIASEEGDWSITNLERLLTWRKTPSFRYVVKMVNNLAEEGLVDIVRGQNPSALSCRVSKRGLNVLKGAER